MPGSPLTVEWGEREGEACIRIVGGAIGAAGARAPRVYPTELSSSGTAGLPPMAGRCGADESGVWFVPRFGFVAGTSYTVEWGADAVVLDSPADDLMATTTVQAIYPTAATIPYNQLRLYVHFSAPMSEGPSADHVRVRDAQTGDDLPDALLAASAELWDRDRRRLTLLFDPARIKRGLLPHREAGYPLAVGRPVEVVIDASFPDARGRPLAHGCSRRYEVGPDVRAHVDPSQWRLQVPRAGTDEPLVVDFDRPLDHGLLQHSLSVQAATGHTLRGTVGTGPEEMSWAFFPAQPWAAGAHNLEVDHRLEDLAGNSLARVFDRDLSLAADDPRPPSPVSVPFSAR